MTKQELIEELEKEVAKCEKIARTDEPLGVIWNLWVSKADSCKYAISLINKLDEPKQEYCEYCLLVNGKVIDALYWDLPHINAYPQIKLPAVYCPSCGAKICEGLGDAIEQEPNNADRYGEGEPISFMKHEFTDRSKHCAVCTAKQRKVSGEG